MIQLLILVFGKNVTEIFPKSYDREKNQVQDYNPMIGKYHNLENGKLYWINNLNLRSTNIL